MTHLLTHFTFFYNTPFTDFTKTLHFDSNSERDDYFLSSRFDTLNITQPYFNFIRDRMSVKLNIDYNDIHGINYCTFLSEKEDRRYYAFVVDYRYINDNVIQVDLMIDTIMTFTQGNILENLKNINISRQHLPQDIYESRLNELSNNDDVIKTVSKNYKVEKSVIFDEFSVIISTSANLFSDFGTVDDPKINTSTGTTYDKIVTPLNIYVMNYDDYKDFMMYMQNYSWITQNIKTIQLVPTLFINDDDLFTNWEKNSTLEQYNIDLKQLDNGTSNFDDFRIEINKELNHNMNDLYNIMNISDDLRHLARNEYMTIELYNYTGQQLLIEPNYLNRNTGLIFDTFGITAIKNEIVVYIHNYRTQQQNVIGSYVNDSIMFNEFDDLPKIIDSTNLTYSMNANRRELAQSKLITNRAKNIIDTQSDVKSKLFDVMSIASNLSLTGIGSQLNEEYEHFRSLNAEMSDLSLQPQTVTNQTYGNSLNISNDTFGLHLKIAIPDEFELNKIKKYYKTFGIQDGNTNTTIESLTSMTIMNYLQIDGTYTIDNIDVTLLNILKSLLEIGVQFYHTKELENPFDVNILNNEWNE